MFETYYGSVSKRCVTGVLSKLSVLFPFLGALVINQAHRFCIDATTYAVPSFLISCSCVRYKAVVFLALDQGFPSWGTCCPRGCFWLFERVHLRLAIEGKDLFVYYFFPNIYTYISEYYFQKQISFEINRSKLFLRHKNGLCLYSSKNLKALILYLSF